MKNKIDKKVLFSIIIGIVLSFMTSVLAETLVKSADVSYTDNAKLGANNVQDALDKTCTKFSNELSNFLNKIYPVGSIYISTANTNPSTFLGGTWENYADGRTLKGISSGTSGQTGGASTVTLTTANLPAHTHTISHTHTTPATVTTTMSLTAQSAGAHTHQINGNPIIYTGDGGMYTSAGGNGWRDRNGIYTTSSGAHTHSVTGSVTVPAMTTNSISTSTSGSTGSGTAINVQDPYITVYMWRRTK